MESASVTRYAAFLRAINVGGRTVTKDRLSQLFEDLGYRGVVTFLASGNVIFETSAVNPDVLAVEIEGHLETSLGYRVATFVRSIADVVAIASYDPFPDSGDMTRSGALYVGFMQSPLDDELHDRVMVLSTPDDEFHVRHREVYWRCHGKISESPVSGALLERAIRTPLTLRNMNTVRRIAERYSAS